MYLKTFSFELNTTTLDLSVVIGSSQDVQKSSNISRKIFKAALLLVNNTILSMYSSELIES